MNYSEQELSHLLGRELASVDLQPLRSLFSGQSLMVTGAAGSIGSELCGQILLLGPKTLVCLDHDETAVFDLEHRLSPAASGIVEYYVDDAGDSERIRELVREHRVKAVFHAAAYKHVPLMERNPTTAVKNNVIALRRALQAAEDEGVEDFVLISSDKAVNPASVMGCTKRVGELLCSSWDGNLRTMSVRFGNVLGSQGSVLPTLREHLQQGGPLRVTHPEASRFFLTIREAVSLLLVAFSLGEARNILVLKVGEPVSIVGLAQRVAGLLGSEGTSIVFTGLRAGEKLHEELFYSTEMQMPTAHENIIRAHRSIVDGHELSVHLDILEQCIADSRDGEPYQTLAKIVPEYDRAGDRRSAEVKL